MKGWHHCEDAECSLELEVGYEFPTRTSPLDITYFIAHIRRVKLVWPWTK